MGEQPEFLEHVAVGSVFRPTTPIDESSLFSGRVAQMNRVFEVVAQRGQHVIIFGERGVGKTSLANVLGPFLMLQGTEALCPRATAVSDDTYSTLWRKVFSEITYTEGKEGLGFTAKRHLFDKALAERIEGDIDPDTVRRVLSAVGSERLLLVIIDELDRLSDDVKTSIADTVKLMSDYAVRVTLVLVGVGDSVDELIHQHASIERALVQIRMPRMSPDEIRDIIRRGLSRIDMTVDSDALDQVVALAQGLPHYAHLLGLYATLNALQNPPGKAVSVADIEAAIQKAVDNAEMSIRTAYNKATASPRAESLYRQVLLACALAQTDDLGFFQPAAVRDPMSKLMKKFYDIPSFSRHLYDFTEGDRGPVLQRTGTARKFRYRFMNPLLQPYIIMRGLADDKIDSAVLRQLLRRRG